MALKKKTITRKKNKKHKREREGRKNDIEKSRKQKQTHEKYNIFQNRNFQAKYIWFIKENESAKHCRMYIR